MKVSYRTIGGVWGNFEAPHIYATEGSIPGQVALFGANSRESALKSMFTHYVGDAVQYTVGEKSS